MKLIPCLVNIEEDETQNDEDLAPAYFKKRFSKLGEFFPKVKAVEFLDDKKFKKGTNLGEGLWTIYTHYRVDGKFFQLAFKPKLEENESIDNYAIRFNSNGIEDYPYRYLRYLKEYDIFLETTMYETLLGYKRKLDKKNIFDTAGYISLEIINIKTKNRETIPIRVLPSSIDYEDYIEMIEDLISIREDIIISDGSKVGIGNQWEKKRDSFVDCIDNIYNNIIQINNNPSGKLSLENVKLQYAKMKKLKPKTIIERSIYPYKNKYSTSIGVEDLNIYENQIIKYSLIQIKEKINRFRINLNKKFDYDSEYLEQIKGDLVNIYGKNLDYKKIELEEYIQEKESEVKKMISQTDKGRRYSTNCIEIIFSIQSNLWRLSDDAEIKIRTSYNQYTKEYTLNLKSTYYNDYKYHNMYDFDTNRENFKYRKLGDTRVYKAEFKTRMVNFEVRTKDIRKIKFIYDKLINKDNRKIHIYAIAQNHNVSKEDPLLKERSEYQSRDSISIDCEDIISINNDKIPNYTLKELGDFINSVYIDLSNETEQLGFIDSLDNKVIDLKQRKQIFDNDRLLQQTIDKIDKLLNLDVFKNIKVKKDVLKPTQIFINDFLYNKVFRELKLLDKKVHFLDGISPDMYFLKTTANIYENWCLYKIVDVLMNELKWKLLNKEEVLQDIDALLKYNGKYNKPCVTIKMEHEIYDGEIISLDLIYEGKIYYDKDRYKTPDYQFRFRSKTMGQKIIYLDAKYRNYNEQGNRTFLKDINNVAIGKYHLPFIGTPNNSEVSFIVHSDKHEKYTCFGGNQMIIDYQVKDVHNYSEAVKLNGETNEHRFGAFYLLPSYSYNLNKFLKMILEYHLGIYDICWNCGEVEDITIEEKRTMGGNKKYHYTCNKCNEFWVKNHCYENIGHALIKHIDNYHSVNKNKQNPWYVICPICFNGMERIR